MWSSTRRCCAATRSLRPVAEGRSVNRTIHTKEIRMAENPLLILADHAADWRTRPLPEHVAHHARRALIDWFAALLPGCAYPPATLLAAAMAAERGPGHAICYVDG